MTTKNDVSKQKQALQSSDSTLSLFSQTRKNPLNKDFIKGSEKNTGAESSNILNSLFQTSKTTKSVNFASPFNDTELTNKNDSKRNLSSGGYKGSSLNNKDVDDEHVQMLEQTISSLKKEISSLKYEVRSSQDEAEEWKIMYENLQKKYTKDIGNLKESHEQELENLNEEHKKELKHQIEVIEKEAQIKALKANDNE